MARALLRRWKPAVSPLAGSHTSVAIGIGQTPEGGYKLDAVSVEPYVDKPK